MKKVFALLTVVLCFHQLHAQKIKPEFLKSIPVAYKNCGSLYTFDSIALVKKKYIIAVDMQNTGVMMLAGKMIKLTLETTTTTGSVNKVTYKGGGYAVTLIYSTKSTKGDISLEQGSVEISKGAVKSKYIIHGETSCDETTQEGNGG